MALMISIDCKHPDIEEFINLKTKAGVCEKANISVRVTNAFMQAAIADRDWETEFTSPETGTITKTFKARELLKLLAKRNWEWAEPGLLYWDNITQYNMLDTDESFSYAGVNPCAEEPLPAGGSCLLGSINLSEFVKHSFTEEASVDFEELIYTVRVAVKALNDVLDEGQSLHPLREQRDSVKDWRQIGLGTMGLADMLIKLGVTYGSTEATKVAGEVYKVIAKTAIEESLELAKEFGAYPKCKPEQLASSTFINSIDLPQYLIDEICEYGLRNSQLLTCAPTGSIATMLQVSTGVEPNFALKYTRKTQSLNGKDTYYDVNAKIVEDFYDSRFMCTEGRHNGLPLPDYFVESKDIAPIDRIKMQGVLQKYTDASISSTINLPKEATVDDVYNIYIEGWKNGLKGVTVYRSGCYREGILIKEAPGKKSNEDSTVKEEVTPLKRGEIIKAGNSWVGLKRTLTTGCGTLHCTAYFDPNNGELRECYLSKGSTGGCNNFMVGLSRMISLSARGGIGIDAILDQLKSCGVCPSYAVRKATKKDTSPGSCCPVAVGKALKEMYDEFNSTYKVVHQEYIAPKVEMVSDFTYEKCPECHAKTLSHIGGCVQCSNCGYSKCD